MTTYSKRRGRRSLAAILAAMLMASVLAVVAGSPAHAANTSSEALVDHDNDPKTDMVREFGGRDRYDTALHLANNFGKAKGLDAVPVAFVASGYKLVDAVSVSGLAGFFDAPILLTPSDSLHGGVADFIEDYGVGTIHILGGAGAVSDGVVEAIESLANEPTVSRIQGADRYETAAAAASLLGGGAAWCGGEDPAAILANGGDVSLVDAMMVGPIAHRLQLPLLLTAADELPMGTADFIEAEDIEHVVIVGNTDAVSEDVANALSDAGVDTVVRIAGATAGATSVELAGLLTGDCKDDLAPVSENTVALVSMDGLPDGVAASPVLSSTYNTDGGLVPMLVVGDTLPASVRDYLAATPEVDSNGNKLNLSIVAIGGGAAVSEGVMSAAVAAAASADALSVQIGNGGTGTDSTTDTRVDVNKDTKMDANDAPQVGDNKIVLYFSDNINATGLESAIRDILEINGAPARLAATTPVTHGIGTNAACDPDTVTVHLANALKAGDTVSVVAGAKLGANEDERAIGATSTTIAAPPADRTRPTLSVIMIAGETTANITTSEDGVTALAAGAEVELTRAATGKTVSVTDLTLTFSPALAAGDRITISAGAVTDAAGNKSLQRSFTAIAEQKSPRITSVIMSNLNHTAQAVGRVPATLTGGAGTAPDTDRTDNPDIWIAAKSDGAAAGAAGNTWSVVFDRASTYDAAKDLDIDVRVNSRDQTVFVRFNNGKAKFSDLQAALEANSAFDALFELKVDADPTSITGGACGRPADSELAIDAANSDTGAAGLTRGVTASNTELASGVTKVAIQVTFNAYISAHDDDELLNDVLAATLARAQKAEAAATQNDVRTALTLASIVTAVGDTQNVVASYPGTKVTYRATTSNAAMLPMVRDLVVTTAAEDADDTETTDVDETVDVATGYADNDSTTADQNESMNAGSQVRIGRSSAVEAPK